MIFTPRRLTCGLIALCATAAQAQLPPVPVPVPVPAPATSLRGDATRFAPAEVPERARVLALLNATASAQIAALDAQPVHIPGRTAINTNWISATFLIGLGRLARVSDTAGARAYLRDVAEHYNFGLLGAWSPHNQLDADNVAIGEVYQELYAHSGQAAEITPLRQRLDYTALYLGVEPAPKRLVWWWADAMFMAPPVFARAAVQTGDRRYLNAMDAQWWRTYDRLWSSQHGLYFRDERFPARRTRGGKPVFWGRGNGWVVGGLARVLEAMPADFTSRPRYIKTFQTMMTTLARLQRKEDGLWTANLLDPTDPPGAETTGSAFFTYAMAFGINHGLLDRTMFLPRVERAWAGLAAKVQPNGLLGYAQRAGDQPEPSGPDDHALYGTGALLLAGLEVMALDHPATPLPIAEPQRDPPGPVRLPIALLPRPSDPGRLAAWQRAMAERQAMIDLAFDPSDLGAALAASPEPAPKP